MEAKNVIKKTILIISIGFVNMTFCQKTKYLLFDGNKDTIVTDIDKTKYYKIDKNLFDINRFNEIDTICKKEISEIKYTSVNKLWEVGKKISDSILAEGIKRKKIKIVESNNQIFERIYILEKITNKKYKRTRVWWVDY
ncbi:MAG: hypothetical protein ACPF80_02590 [Flavobacteriaceae bacterium]